MKKILLQLLLLLSVFPALSQQVYKNGGTSNSTFLFGYASYAAKSQCLFLPSDLTNIMAGDIIRVYYRYGTSGAGLDQTLTNFTISLGQTTDTAYSGTTFFTGVTPVFSAASYTITGGVAGNWFSIDLTSPYTYDSTQTLIVQLTFSASAINAWGTYGTSNANQRKMISGDINATDGDLTSGTWQDFGFDLGTIGIAESGNNLKFEVFPNPSHDKLQIRSYSLENESATLSIINSLGEEVISKTCNSYFEEVNVTNLPAGIYFAKYIYKGASVVKKVIIN